MPSETPGRAREARDPRETDWGRSCQVAHSTELPTHVGCGLIICLRTHVGVPLPLSTSSTRVAHHVLVPGIGESQKLSSLGLVKETVRAHCSPSSFPEPRLLYFHHLMLLGLVSCGCQAACYSRTSVERRLIDQAPLSLLLFCPKLLVFHKLGTASNIQKERFWEASYFLRAFCASTYLYFQACTASGRLKT